MFSHQSYLICTVDDLSVTVTLTTYTKFMEDLERKLEILDKEVDESMNTEGLVVSRRDCSR